MSRLTWDEAKAREREILNMQERQRRNAALLKIGAAVVRDWDDTHAVCPWCVSDIEDPHDEECPGPLVEAYIEKHGRAVATPDTEEAPAP